MRPTREAVQQMLARLRADDPTLKRFGAEGHGYRRNPPLTGAETAAIALCEMGCGGADGLITGWTSSAAQRWLVADVSADERRGLSSSGQARRLA